MTEKTAAEVEAEVGQILQDLYDAVKRVELEPWMETLHSPTGRWLLGMDVVNLRQAIEELGTAWTSEGEIQLARQEIDDLEIRVDAVSSTVAHALCTSPDRRWYFANGKVERASTAETWVFTLTDEGWKLQSGQSSLFPVKDETFSELLTQAQGE
jgi:hypothetical protein